MAERTCPVCRQPLPPGWNLYCPSCGYTFAAPDPPPLARRPSRPSTSAPVSVRRSDRANLPFPPDRPVTLILLLALGFGTSGNRQARSRAAPGRSPDSRTGRLRQKSKPASRLSGAGFYTGGPQRPGCPATELSWLPARLDQLLAIKLRSLCQRNAHHRASLSALQRSGHRGAGGECGPRPRISRALHPRQRL